MMTVLRMSLLHDQNSTRNIAHGFGVFAAGFLCFGIVGKMALRSQGRPSKYHIAFLGTSLLVIGFAGRQLVKLSNVETYGVREFFSFIIANGMWINVLLCGARVLPTRAILLPLARTSFLIFYCSVLSSAIVYQIVAPIAGWPPAFILGAQQPESLTDTSRSEST